MSACKLKHINDVQRTIISHHCFPMCIVGYIKWHNVIPNIDIQYIGLARKSQSLWHGMSPALAWIDIAFMI